MGDKINKEFEKFQKELEIRKKKLKLLVKFVPDDKVDKILNELKDKSITL